MADKLGRRLRFEILRRDGHTCRYCGAMAPDVVLTIDHVIPTSLGGSDDPSNLVAACVACNGGKASVAPGGALVAQVEEDAIRWARAIATAAEFKLAERRVIDDLIGYVDAAWNDWNIKATGERLPRPDNWRDTIERFLAAGLPVEEIRRLVGVAMSKTNLPVAATWRYFCGCCWRALTELQEAARQILESGADQ